MIQFHSDTETEKHSNDKKTLAEHKNNVMYFGMVTNIPHKMLSFKKIKVL